MSRDTYQFYGNESDGKAIEVLRECLSDGKFATSYGETSSGSVYEINLLSAPVVVTLSNKRNGLCLLDVFSGQGLEESTALSEEAVLAVAKRTGLEYRKMES